jgi:coenzyme F420-reducing hydrogenase alpha subunit
VEVKKINITVNRITRVEGHGKLVVRSSDGKPAEVRWEVTESPRFFELMLRGRPWHDAHVLASRICGICSVSHQFASLAATEAAFGIQPSEQTMLLRRLLYIGEMIESHMLHVYLMASPDFFGTSSIFPLMETNKDIVLAGLRLKKLGNEIMELVGGRAVHPQAAIVGGFGRLPDKQILLYLQKRLHEVLPDLEDTVKVFKQLDVPQFFRETEYIALKYPGEYALVRGLICSTDTGATPLDQYLDITNEYCIPPSTAKFTKHARESYAVGALARININYDHLNPLAKKAAAELGLKPICCNPFLNTRAQIVETIHEVEEGQYAVDRLLQIGVREEKISVTVKAGQGVGAVEAPRGLLIHDYSYDESGRIVKANCVIPTNQNHANIQRDLEALVQKNLSKSEKNIKLLCEMLIRSYDPCISCSTH